MTSKVASFTFQLPSESGVRSERTPKRLHDSFPPSHPTANHPIARPPTRMGVDGHQSSPRSDERADAAQPNTPTAHAAKRQRGQGPQQVQPPQPTPKGGSVTTQIAGVARAALRSRLDEEARQAQLKRDVLDALATTIDEFVAAQPTKEKKNYAQEVCNNFIKLISLGNLTVPDTKNHRDTRAASLPANPASTMAPQGTQGRAATWAEIAALPGKNKAPGNTTTRPTMPPKNAIAPAKTQQTGHAGRKGSPEDRRVLITMPSERLLTRPEAYAVRQALVGCVPGLDSMGSIPEVSRTNTGWAVTPANQATRDLLMRGESIKAICQTLGATGVNLPQKWLNYAVPGVPSTIRDHEGKPMETGPLIADEAYYQTGLKPVSCRPSRHGADPKTGRTTWIVSFLERPPSFRLFNTSQRARQVTKQPPIRRHDPGCQGYCHPPKCDRRPRCSHCGQITADHPGPTGPNCRNPPGCANCYGPFPSGHEKCPAAPQRVNGTIVRPTKKQLRIIRTQGARAAKEARTQEAANAQIQKEDKARNNNSRKRPATEPYDDLTHSSDNPPPAVQILLPDMEVDDELPSAN